MNGQCVEPLTEKPQEKLAGRRNRLPHQNRKKSIPLLVVSQDRYPDLA